MRLIALEIPDDATAFAGWLEGHLAGLDLAALVAELEAVHGPPGEAFPLERVLGDRREAVRARGLEELPRDRLRTLLRQPRLLLELQEWLLIEGGPYWQRLASDAASPESSAIVERGWERLAAELEARPVSSISIRAPGVRPSRGRGWRWIVSLASAAAVLVAIVVVQRRTDRGENGHPGPIVAATPRWGWDRPDALPQDLPRSAYLNHLADAAHEWFHQRPDTPIALARRIAEFRQGCSVLILSPHRPLSAEDRTWLVEKCRSWAVKLDAHLAAVEAGRDPLAVRREADETIDRLIVALRERAQRSV